MLNKIFPLTLRRLLSSHPKTKQLEDVQHKKICNICGNHEFTLGPGGRLSHDRITPPCCTTCHSLERHRSFRTLFDKFIDNNFKNLSALQFSPDMVIDRTWFRTYEVSEFGGENSLDIQNIAKADNSYDVIICNHVLEHVPDDKAGLSELFRIVKPGGFLFLSIPDPLRRKVTEDWGYPNEEQHGHYRMYGKDVHQMLKKVLPNSIIFYCIGTDPVTLAQDIAFIITDSTKTSENLSLKIGQTITV